MPTNPKIADAVALDALLDAERAALLQGDLVGLAGLLPDKEALIDALNAVHLPDATVLKGLEIKVRRNYLLLDEQLEGMRGVATQIAVQKSKDRRVKRYHHYGLIRYSQKPPPPRQEWQT